MTIKPQDAGSTEAQPKSESRKVCMFAPIPLKKGVKPRIRPQNCAFGEEGRPPTSFAQLRRFAVESAIQRHQRTSGGHHDTLEDFLRHRRPSYGCTHARSRPEGHNFFAEVAEGGGDGLMHVKVLIRTEPAAEEDVVLASGQPIVGREQLAVTGGIHWIVRLIAAAGKTRIFTADEGPARWIMSFGMQMFKLVDTCIRHVLISVVNDGCTLVVLGRQRLALKV